MMSRRALRIIATIAALIVAVLSLTALHAAAAPRDAARTQQPAAAPGNDWSSEPLLLIHGFTDTCQDAWQTSAGSAQPGDSTAVGYLGGAFGTIDQVGYYTVTASDGTSDRSSCSEDINQMSLPGMSGCDNLPDVAGSENSSQYGTINDHIDRLACLLAWYVYDTYTAPSGGVSQPVNVLAHSMGGLLIQDAIGATSHGVPYFPPHPLRVLRVVTVATPHGGIPYPYFEAAYFTGDNSNELNDLGTGSSFLTTLASYGKPQGAGGTFWGLMGAADSAYPYTYTDSNGNPATSCPAPSGTAPYEEANRESCLAFSLGDGNPDGDGVVPTFSMMAMQADIKVLYGIWDNNVYAGGSVTADPATQYEHEVNTPGVSGNLQPPFYLNDGRGGTTKAFVCASNCNASSDMSDLNLTPVAVPYSLAEITALLENPVVSDISGGGQFATEWAANGGATGTLGLPLSHEYAVAGGQELDFQHGSIYWSSATGTHTLYGPAFTDYTNFGGPASALGFPASDALTQTGGGLEWQFPGTNCGTTGLAGSGSVILTGGPTYTSGATTPAAEVQGCIFQAYDQLDGGPGGSLGYPTTDEKAIASGRVSYFTGGSSKPGCSTGSEPADGMTTAALYWDGTVHAVTGCIFAEYDSLGEAAGSLGFPTDDAYAYNGGNRQDFQNGYISGGNGSYTATLGSGNQWVVGHAQHAGDDYPYQTLGQFEHQYEGTDAWAEYYGQCDSFAAWKVYENLYGTTGNPMSHPSILPAPGWTPPDASISPVNQNTWFNADNWDVMGRKAGWTVNTIPSPGAIAYWPNATTDPQDGHATSPNGIGEFGHVGYVTDVYPDGSVTIEGYNLRVNGEYSTIHMAYGQSATDTSFNLGTFTVPWPTYFIHVADGPELDGTSPPEPANGTVSWGYPSGLNHVVVIGPGSSSSQYSLGNVWYQRTGHGELGNEEWTHTNGATAVSTATYSPSGLAASTCYRVDAFVPDNYSDNPVAVYTVSDVNGTHMAAVNDNVYTNDWAELGVYETDGSGGITVKLDDRGTTGLYVAADAMRFWRQASCGSYGDVAPIMMPGTSNGTWTGDAGHGFLGSMKYATTSGSLTATGSNAGWVPSTLLPNTCYSVAAYVPDNYSDNDAARYEVIDGYYGTFWPQVNENAFTNQFAPMGGFFSTSSGGMSVTLTNMGPSGQYVAADAVAFTPDPLCEGPTGSGLGQVYPANVIGPGSSPANFVTTNPWYLQLGHGYVNHELWTYDNGSAADSTATWTFAGSANTCYSVAAYVPDNYADNPQAHYAVGTSAGGVALTMDQQSYTNQFAWLASVRTGSDGVVTVHLTDQGPAADSSGNPLYTAADAMQFTANGTGC